MPRYFLERLNHYLKRALQNKQEYETRNYNLKIELKIKQKIIKPKEFP